MNVGLLKDLRALQQSIDRDCAPPFRFLLRPWRLWVCMGLLKKR